MATTSEVERLLSSVRATDDMSREIELAHELGKLGDPAVDLLIAAIPDVLTRWAAVTALGRIGSSEAIASIIPICKDIDPTIRGAAVIALGKIGGEKIVPTMIDVVDTEEGGMIRTSAIQALGAAGVPDPVEFLTALVEDPTRDKYDRREATQALGSLGGDDVIASLRTFAADDGDEYVRKFAAEALDALGAA